MKAALLLEDPVKQHPFIYAYQCQDAREKLAFTALFKWVTAEYGVDAPLPPLWIVSHEHMQHAARNVPHYSAANGIVIGWYSQEYQKLFLNDRVKITNSRREAAVVVHEIVHYLQDVSGKQGTVDDLEADADAVMSKFLRSK